MEKNNPKTEIRITLSEDPKIKLKINDPRGPDTPGLNGVSDQAFGELIAENFDTKTVLILRENMEIEIEDQETKAPAVGTMIQIYNPTEEDVKFMVHLLQTCRHTDYIRRQLRSNMKIIETEKKEAGKA